MELKNEFYRKKLNQNTHQDSVKGTIKNVPPAIDIFRKWASHWLKGNQIGLNLFMPGDLLDQCCLDLSNLYR